jgi:hypothetical protein
MKLKKKILRTGLALSLGLLLTPLAANACCHAKCQGKGPVGLSGVVSSLPYEELSAEETAGLVQMREEEKLARDVYQVLAEKWSLAVFTNIAGSEQRHMDAVKSLLDKYNIDDPIIDSTIGVFTNPDLQALFDQLTAKGNESMVDALQVGATIEDLDIYDLEEFISQADNKDINTVYQNLLKGSRNHLRAFWYQLSLNGGEYEAQYISAEEFAAIVTSDRERGRVDADGNKVKNRGRNSRGTGNCQRLSLDDITGSSGFLLARHGGGNGRGHGSRHNKQHRYNSQNSDQHQYKRKGHGPGDGTGNSGNGPKDGTGNGPGTGDCQNTTEAT